MSVSRKTAQEIRDRLLRGAVIADQRQKIQPRFPEVDPLPPRIPGGNDHTTAGMEKRQEWLKSRGLSIENLSGQAGVPDARIFEGNIENLVGFAQIPIGLIGPLRINGTEAYGDFYVPMATSEGALVASYHRGAYVISQSGGATTVCLTESVVRAPCFVFETMSDACLFLDLVIRESESFQKWVSVQSHHCRFIDLHPSLIGRNVYLGLEYQTEDAAGQNMVTLATDAICKQLVEKSPVKPSAWYVEGNLSGDKKATMLSFLSARGKKVIAEVVVTQRLLKKIVHVTPVEFARYGHIATLGAVQSGSIGAQGHYANALAALFIACGQDVACVAEASTGLTDMDVTADDELYISVTLPNLIVGTVGGGTHLPTARECLALVGCEGKGTARKFAEICAATVLAGEISIIGALAAGEFADAHARYRRRQ